jgi:hypothetical protein
MVLDGYIAHILKLDAAAEVTELPRGFAKSYSTS